MLFTGSPTFTTAPSYFPNLILVAKTSNPPRPGCPSEDMYNISSFVIHANDEIQIADIQLASDGLSAILEMSSSLNEEDYTTISCIRNTVVSEDGGVLNYFGPKEIEFGGNPPTGVKQGIRDEQNKNDKVKIYHNINSAIYKVFSEERIQKIKVYDINGRILLKDHNINETIYSFTGHDFPKGVLIVVVNDVYPCKVINL